MGDTDIKVLGSKRLEPESSPAQKFREQIAHFAIRLRPKIRRLCSDKSRRSRVKVVCISDTHNAQPQLPAGDLLVHAGDLTQNGTLEEAQAQLSWLAAQQGFAHRVVIAGNHDFALRDRRSSLTFDGITFLQDETATLAMPYSSDSRDLRVHGTPWTPEYGQWAFQYPRALGQAFWSSAERRIPGDTDVLVVHGPPRRHLDSEGSAGATLGCAGLAEVVRAAQPRLVVCGHVHGGRGREDVVFDRAQVAFERIAEGTGGWLVLAALGWGLVSAWASWLLKREQRVTSIVNASQALPAGGASRADEDERGAIVITI